VALLQQQLHLSLLLLLGLSHLAPAEQRSTVELALRVCQCTLHNVCFMVVLLQLIARSRTADGQLLPRGLPFVSHSPSYLM
jgi:hypothetical protein